MSDITRVRIDLPALNWQRAAKLRQEVEEFLINKFPTLTATVTLRDMATPGQIEDARNDDPHSAVDDDAEVSYPDGEYHGDHDFIWIQVWQRVDRVEQPVTPERLKTIYDGEFGDDPPDAWKGTLGEYLTAALAYIHGEYSPTSFIGTDDVVTLLEQFETTLEEANE